MTPSKIFLASVLLEPNRWGPLPRIPRCRLVDWLVKIGQARFDGIELWENHWIYADRQEREALISSPVPIRVYNTYLIPSEASAEELSQLTGAVSALGATVCGVKFNLGGAGSNLTMEVAAALQWSRQFRQNVTLLCECHADTVMESPATAVKAFDLWPAARFGAILHPFLGENAEFNEWLRRLGARVEHMHLQMRDASLRLIPIADRESLANSRLHAVHASGFHGSLTIEFTAGVGEPDEDPQRLLDQAGRDLECVRAIWATTIPRNG